MLAKLSMMAVMKGGVVRGGAGDGVWKGWVGFGIGISWYKAKMLLV